MSGLKAGLGLAGLGGEPLDPAADMPEGLNFDVWDRLVEARAAKIQTEADLKASAEQLAEMSLFLDELAAADDEVTKLLP